MGLQASKPDPSFTVPQKRNYVCDDGLSKATVTTEDSSVMQSSAQSANISHAGKTAHSQAMIHGRQSWRSGSAPNFAQVAHRSQKSEHISGSNIPKLLRRDSDPGTPNMRRPSVPVKCPPRRRRSTAIGTYVGTESGSSAPDGDDSIYLMRMYDTRTWEMYRRITEARKHSQCSYARNNNSNTKLDHTIAGENTSEWENLQHEYPDSVHGHETIFLFDFD